MLRKYKQFLGTRKLTISGIWNALKLTKEYYKQRSALKTKHKLRFYNLPSLLYLQHKNDKALKNDLRTKIINQYKLERKEDLENILQSSNLNSKFHKIEKISTRELQNLREKGFFSYSFEKLSELRIKLLVTLSPEVASKWIVKYVNLYHKSLEELVEGHREVTRNHDTVLDDGQTVNQKLQDFENKITKSTWDYEKLKNYKDNIK